MFALLITFVFLSTSTATLTPRDTTCSIFTQVRAAYNTTGPQVPIFDDPERFNCTTDPKYNPHNTSCAIFAVGTTHVSPTYNLTSPPSNILSLLSTPSVTWNASLHVEISTVDPKNESRLIAYLPAAQLGYVAYSLTMSCVDGTLGGCDGNRNGTTAVSACRPIIAGVAINGTDPYYTVVADVEVVVTTGQPNNCSDNGVEEPCSQAILGGQMSAGTAVLASCWGIVLVALGMLML